jgi:superoxide dismutase, Fe-Mn family
VAIEPGTYEFGPANGVLSVLTSRTGAAAKAGHDLLIHVTAWQARLELTEDGTESSLVLDADATSLRVREGIGGMQELGDDDKANIEQTIGDEILLGKAIEFRSTSVRPAAGGSRITVQGELTLVGAARPISFTLAVGADGRLSGRAVLTQSDWGITPYSTLFGALKVVDEVEVVIDAGLSSEVAVWRFAYEEVAPREPKPALLELDGISRVSVAAHFALYRGYVSKRGEILRKLAVVDRTTANQISSELRSLNAGLSFAIAAIKNHEVYFEHLGGAGGDPGGPIAELITRDFGSSEAWRSDLKATGMAGRGWAWTAYDWDEGRLFNYLGDDQHSYPIWNATPLIALDVDEHAYFLDFQTDRAAYIDAFFDNLDWAVVNDWVAAYGIPLQRGSAQSR